jgi:hypothetical protein
MNNFALDIGFVVTKCPKCDGVAIPFDCLGTTHSLSISLATNFCMKRADIERYYVFIDPLNQQFRILTIRNWPNSPKR